MSLSSNKKLYIEALPTENMNKRTFGRIIGTSLLATLAGCQGRGGSINGNAAPELAALVLSGASVFQKDPARGAAMQNVANTYVGLKAATNSSGSNQVIINGYDPSAPQRVEGQQQPTGPRSLVFACNRTEDRNNNGVIDYPSEFVGRDTTFYCEDRVEFYVGGNRQGPYELTSNFWYDDSQMFDAHTRTVSAEEAARPFQFVENIKENSRIPSGDYRVDVFIDKQFVGQLKFRIHSVDASGVIPAPGR